MKKNASVFLCLLSAGFTSAAQQCLEYKWSKGEEAVITGTGRNVSCGTDGLNAFVGGTFDTSSVTLDSVTLNNTGSRDAFLYKLDKDGNVLWGRSPAGSGSEGVTGVASGAGGNVAICGSFDSDTLDFTVASLVRGGTGTDIFIAGYNSAGTAQWAIKPAGNNPDLAHDVAMDDAGNTYVCGTYKSTTLNFGTGSVNNSFPTHYDPFVAKIDNAGNALWVKGPTALSGGLEDEARGVAVDAGGNVYMCGYFSSNTLNFPTDTLTNSGLSLTRDVFLAKYDPSGNFLWAKSGGGQSEDEAFDVAVDAFGNAYIVGYFNGFSASFGSVTVTNTDLNFGDMFVVKYSVDGTEMWGRNGTGNNEEVAYRVETGPDNLISVTGFFNSSSLTFGTYPLLATNPGGDIFFVQYDVNGTATCALGTDGDTGDDRGFGIAVDDSGDVYLAGIYNSRNLNIGTNILTNNGSGAAFYLYKAGDTASTPSGIPFTISDEAGVINFFPNPAEDWITISCEQGTLTAAALFNLTGQLVAETEGEGSIRMDTRGMNPGMYLLKLVNQYRTAAGKVMIGASAY